MGNKTVIASTAFVTIGGAMIIVTIVSQYWAYYNSGTNDHPVRVSTNFTSSIFIRHAFEDQSYIIRQIDFRKPTGAL